jgi:outer membrane receptor for ferrienterochelin and colicins
MKTNILKILMGVSLLILLLPPLASQNVVGYVYEVNLNNQKSFLPGVDIYWLGTTTGVASDENGRFVLSKTGINTTKLVVSLMGFKTDTVELRKELTKIDIQMVPSTIQLQEVQINAKVSNTYISRLSPRKVQVITEGELKRAACCNLSESFETNASIDVTYSDAITGAKQIQLLGLSGIYSQIQTENIPSIRGMSSAYGLSNIPGPWMQSIQISKGTASVINGYESITGQINVEYKKPRQAEKLYVNLFGNSNGRMEANLYSGYKLNEKWSTLLLVHGDYFGNKINKINTTEIFSDGGGEKQIIDENFMDIPMVNTVNLFNRWEYIGKKYETRFGIKYLSENRNGGTLDFDKDTFVLDTAKINNKALPYGFELNTRRTEAFWKNGFLFPGKEWKSLGIIFSGVNHEQDGFFGVNNYHGHERSLYANLIYQSIIGNTNHKFSTGLSYLFDDFTEGYDQVQFTYIYQTLLPGQTPTMHDVLTLSPQTDLTPKIYNFDRQESIPGAFFEYTYTYLDKLTFIAGIRADHHNKSGFFVTPRANLRYQITESAVIRLSGGLGYRSANIISENISLLASQRILVVNETLNQEKAANYGISFMKEFRLFKRPAEFDVDLYRTDFINQVIVDLDTDPTKAYFYNLEDGGKSYANSLQVQLTLEPINRLTVLLAFRLNDANQTTNDTLRQRALVNKYKGLISLSYATNFDKWKFDLTGQFNGSARISPQYQMPPIVRRDYETSPSYFLLYAQVTKKFKHNFEVYLGGENLTGFLQKDPITEPFIPYHTHFDTTMVWGPIVGTTIYGGLRYTIK